MKKYFAVPTTIAFASIISLFSFGSPAIAGDFAEGYGETIEEAQAAALAAAETVVRSRGKGCVSRYNGEIFHNLQKRNVNGIEIWYVQAHYSKHGGSCK